MKASSFTQKSKCLQNHCSGEPGKHLNLRTLDAKGFFTA